MDCLLKNGCSGRFEIFCKKYVHEEFCSQENFWLDVTKSLQVRILILSKEAGYLS